MEKVKIQKGKLLNVVSIEQFERQYKMHGWELAEEKEKEQGIPLKHLETETEVLSYIKMQKKRAKKCNDGLLKSEAEG